MSSIALLLLLATAPQSVDLPFEHLPFRKGLRIVEGPRQLGDAFPYLSVQSEDGKRSTELTPKSLAACLSHGIGSAQAAYEAVRLFVAGVPVENGKPLLEEAAKLRPELRIQKVEFPNDPPKSWKRSVEESEDGWTVFFVAYEMDRILQLVSIRASVTKAGKLDIRRTVIFRGPMTSWQSAVLGDADGGGFDRDRVMRTEAARARARFAKALAARRDLDTAFAIARLRLTPAQIEDLWPGKRRVVGSGRRIVAVDLVGGTSAVYDATETDAPIAYLFHTRAEKDKPFGFGERIHRLAVQR